MDGIKIVEIEPPQAKIPLWIFAVFFTTLIIAISYFGFSKYQLDQAQQSELQQSNKVAKLQQAILAQDDVININWLHTLNPLVKDVKGSLLWSSHEQQGIIKISKLPTIEKQQQYHLWIYDLNAKTSAPISALIFNESSDNFILPFKPSMRVDSPFKFELILETKGKAGGLSLLLAQP